MSTSATVVARIAPCHPPYGVELAVNIPWVIHPCVRLEAHEVQACTGPFDKAEFDRFMSTSKRINSESMAIINVSRYGWRLLTAEELRRLDELFAEHEIAVATLQRTRATQN